MIVSPKAAKEAGDKFGPKPVCAGPFKFVERMQQDRIVVERFAGLLEQGQRPHRPHRLSVPIDGFHRAPRQSRVGQLDIIERALATDIKEIRADPG